MGAPTSGSSGASDAGWQLARLLDGFMVTQLLYVAAELDVAEHLSAGPRTAIELAEAVGALPEPLRRVLRGLAAEGVLGETGDGRFALTPLGEALRGLRGAALARGELYYHSAEGLLDAVRDGGVPFERSYGAGFFDHLHDHPRLEAAFQSSMTGRSHQEARDVVATHDFRGLARVVDVGGGQGVLLAAILEATDGLRGTLMDREVAVTAARTYFEERGLTPRVDCVVGDFFDDVPPGADAYLLSRVLHDWDDTDACRILSVCRRAMRADGRLLVVDAVVPESAIDHPAAIRMDLHMLLLFGARERTESEFDDLLERSGFRRVSAEMTPSPAGLAVIEAVPA